MSWHQYQNMSAVFCHGDLISISYDSIPMSTTVISRFLGAKALITLAAGLPVDSSESLSPPFIPKSVQMQAKTTIKL